MVEMSDYFKRGIPKLHRQIERPQLQNILSQVLDYPVTLLSAPPGCGKTTIVAQFAERVPCAVIWHGITDYQQDMRVMVSNLFRSLSEFIPDVQTLNNLVDQPPEVVAHGLARLLHEFTTAPFVLVLDDWHRFSNHHPANQWLRVFIEFMPQNCHLLLLSQTIPPLNMLLMVAKHEILAIQQEDLYFTEAEVYLLATKLQSKLDADALALVWERMRGWAAGTVLTLQPGSNTLLKKMSGENAPSEVLFQSIARDMLKQQAPDIREFLKWTSTVGKFDSTICGEDVLRLASWQESLAEVINKNLFIQEDGSGYKYHELFRNFLQTHFRLTQPEDYAEAHRRVAGWYERQGSIDRAILHYLNANALPRVTDLIESIAHSYFIQGRIESLRMFSDAIEEHWLVTPYFDYVRSRIALDYDADTDQALQYALRALNTFDKEEQPLWFHRTRYQIANIEVRKGNYKDARMLLDDILPDAESFPELYGLVLARRGIALYLTGDLELAIQDLEDALPVLEEHSGWLEQSHVLQDMEVVYRALGNKEAADIALQRLITLRRSLDNREELALALNNLGYLYYEEGRYEEARKTFTEGLETIQLLESGRSRYFLLASLADLERDCGYYDKAREYYQEALALVGDNDPFMRCETLTHLASLYRWQGRSEAAMTCVTEAMQIAKAHQLIGAYHQAQVEALHIKLQPYNLRTVEQEAKNLNGNGTSVEESVLQLRLAHFRNDNGAVDKLLAKQGKLYTQEQAIPFFFAELVNNPGLTVIRQQLITRQGVLAAHLERLLKASDKSIRPTIIPISPPASSIEVFTLGAEIIRRDGQRIAHSDWQSPTARELFYYFIFHEAARRDDVCLIFWEDKPADSAIALFHQMIARIRQTVGQHTILYDESSELYSLNPEIHLWCDAMRADTLAEEARKLGISSPRALELWRQVTNLLTGDFLSAYDKHWMTVLHTKYQDLTLEAWMSLGRCYMAQNDYHTALQSFQVAAQHDELYEAAYRGQMICWGKLGERARVSHTYNLLRANLKKIDARPSTPTDTLLIELLA